MFVYVCFPPDVSGRSQSKFQSHTLSGLESTEKDSFNPFHLELKPEEDCHSQAQDTNRPETQNVHTPKQRPLIPSVANLDGKVPTHRGSKTVSHGISPKLKQKLLGIFKKDAEKTDEVQHPPREQVATPQQEQRGYVLHKGDAEKSLDKAESATKEGENSSTPELRTLQLVALQKTPFKETMTSEDVGMDVQVPERVSGLRAFWERESSACQTRDDTNQSDFTIGETVSSVDPTTVCDVEAKNNNSSGTPEITAEGPTDTSHDDGSLSIPLSKEDGTYRANPVIIYEETDESLTGSLTEAQICEPQENINRSGPSLVALEPAAQEEVAVSNSSSSGDDSALKIGQCEENTASSPSEPLRVKEDDPLGEGISAKEDRRASSDSTENSEVERQMSPRKTKAYVVLRTSSMSSKGFISPERSPLRSPTAARDMQPTHGQSSAYAQVQERPVSPRKCAPARAREQSDEVRRSPSKTCHPKALPRETSGPKAPRLEGSPLKTFPINIEPHIKTADEDHVKPTPVPRPRRSPSHEHKEKTHADVKLSADLPSRDPRSSPPERGACFGPNGLSSSTSPQTKRALPISPTRLARSYVPQDYEHYLGPQEKAYIPPFDADKRATAESDTGHRNHTDSLAYSWAGQSQDKATRACSLSRASLSSERLIFCLQHDPSFRIISVM